MELLIESNRGEKKDDVEKLNRTCFLLEGTVMEGWGGYRTSRGSLESRGLTNAVK